MDLAADPAGTIAKFLFLYICVCALLLWVASKILP
jgi:hypothetical protein